VEPRMLTCVAQTRAAEEVVVAAQDDPLGAVPLELSHRICPAGETVVNLGGELDIASAEMAVSYVRDIIDRHRGPVIIDLTALAFCDARGLAALVRMAGYAEQEGCPFRLASPSPSLVKIMRITGLDHRFLASQASARTLRLAEPHLVHAPVDHRRPPAA
jgi:anti-sigma B factor antagonist